MACSCQSKKSTNPSAQSSKSVYTFTTDTKPMDSCLYCAQKHVSLAQTYLKQHQPWNYFPAAGQLLLCSYHLVTLPAMAKQLHDLAYKLMKDHKAIQLQKFIVQLNQKMLNTQITQQQYPQLIPTQQQDKYQALLHISAAKQLMQQPLYEVLNKGYAIGQLSYAGIILRKTEPQTVNHLRQVWKVIQEIREVDDQYYKDAMNNLAQVISKQLTQLDK